MNSLILKTVELRSTLLDKNRMVPRVNAPFQEFWHLFFSTIALKIQKNYIIIDERKVWLQSLFDCNETGLTVSMKPSQDRLFILLADSSMYLNLWIYKLN